MDVSRKAGKTPCVGQSLPKFLPYNDSVKLLNSKTHPKTFDQLSNPNLELAIKIQTSTSSIYDKTITTVKYNFCDGNNPKDKTMMNDKKNWPTLCPLSCRDLLRYILHQFVTP